MRLLITTLLLGAPVLAQRPNVLLVISDDQGWGDFGFMGSEEVQTPRIDRLAEEGVVFPRAYVPTALCRASLMTLATGLYPHQHRVVGNDPGKGVDRERMLEHIRSLDTLAARLDRAGYRSIQTGKWWEGHWSEGGFTEGMTHGDRSRGGRHGDQGLAIGREGLETLTSFIDDCASEGTPFFAWYAPYLPHRPHNPPDRLLERYSGPGVPDPIARYWACCTWLDETVGELLDHLEARELTEETLVVFLVDNGWITDPKTGRFAPRSKRSSYEGGVRTPLVLRWPGTLEPGEELQPVSSIDVVPTILAACGIAPDDALPGRDLLPLASGRVELEPRPVFGASFLHDQADLLEPARTLTQRWIVKDRWKLIRPADRDQPSELYDVVSDPDESEDLALSDLARVAELREDLDRWWSGDAPRRPNILFLLSDDQRADQLGCAGHPVLQTPNLDALAARGVRFENAFVTTAICAASRASILTGRHERTHGYTFGRPPISDLHAAESYPSVLRAAGYRTGFIGKWGVKASTSGRAAMFDWVRDRTAPYMKQVEGETVHLTDLMARDALEFFSEDDGRPFCLSVSFNAPHAEDPNPDQFIWPSDLDGLYDDVEVPPPALASDEFFQAQPLFMQESLGRVRWGWRFDDEEKRRRMTRGYWRMITGVDRAVGRILEGLEEQGLSEETIVVYTSDNGYFLGDRGFAGKWLIHEPSIRVPLIIHDPAMDPALDGAVREAMALNIDLPSTMLDLAGVPIPGGYQGRSLVSWLSDEQPEAWREDFLYEHRFAHPKIPQSIGVRGERYVYVRYDTQEPVVENLYDLWNDPDQAVDLAADPDHSAVLERMRRRCDELAERPR